MDWSSFRTFKWPLPGGLSSFAVLSQGPSMGGCGSLPTSLRCQRPEKTLDLRLLLRGQGTSSASPDHH